MIQLVVGGKGTGKTKTLVNMANKAMESTKGEIVFISGEKRRMVELSYRVRLIRLRDYSVRGQDLFYGFLSGIISQNYDIEMIYIDGLLEYLKEDIDAVEDLFARIEELSKEFEINFTISMDGEAETVPDFLKEFIS